MRFCHLALLLAGTAFIQTGCAFGFRAQTGPPAPVYPPSCTPPTVVIPPGMPERLPEPPPPAPR